jgi:hypothetical protein
MVSKNPQESINVVSYTGDEWVKVFGNCQYFPGEILEVQSDGLKVYIKISSS